MIATDSPFATERLTAAAGRPAGISIERAPGVMAAAACAAARIPAQMLLALIAGYRRFLSPVLPIVTLGACACRFSPTCSQYAADAVRVHGAVAGSLLALRRLLKCTPLHPGGFDPVPPRAPRPVCRSASQPPPLTSL